MTATIIDGKALAQEVRTKLAKRIEDEKVEAFLAVILVGDDEASKIYDRNKKKAALEVGIDCEIMEFSASIGENALLEVISELNDDDHVSGILVQLPLPEHISPLKVLSKISSQKDVDGFSPYNAGLLQANDANAVVAATPKGILQMLQSTGVELSGRHAVIIGRSNIVGRPIATLLLNHDCTVTITHTKTQNLPEITKQADILVVACGCAKLVKKDWVKQGAIVIDVGMNRMDGKLCGDVDFAEVAEVASFITPVPGGVGPMTVAMLLENTFEAAKSQEHHHTKHHNCHCGGSCNCQHD